MSTVAERRGAGDDRDLGRSGHRGRGADVRRPDHRDPYRDPVHDPGYAADQGYGPDPDPYRDGYPSGGWYAEPGTGEYLEPEPPSGAVVAQHDAVPRGELRADFGAHLETHYPRLVAQLYAVTLHPGDAHDAVQDAYSRAWRRWSALRGDDVVGWVLRVAVRTSMRGWRPGLTRAGIRRSRLPSAEALEPQTAALLETLAALPVAVRRAVVLRHMAGLDVAEIARLEQVRETVVAERLRRGRNALQDGLDEMAGRMVDAVAAVDTGHGAGNAGSTGGRHGPRGERT